MVVLVPVPVVPPGLIVQVPEAGSPFRTTLPVATVHVGGVIVPTVGALGEVGFDTIAEPLGVDVQPFAVIWKFV